MVSSTLSATSILFLARQNYGPDSIKPICDESGEMNSGQEISGELVISGGDAAEVLEPAKAALDDISTFVSAFVEAMDDDAVGFCWG